MACDTCYGTVTDPVCNGFTQITRLGSTVCLTRCDGTQQTIDLRSMNVTDTSTVNLTLTSTDDNDNLKADVKVSEQNGNIIQVNSDGLFATIYASKHSSAVTQNDTTALRNPSGSITYSSGSANTNSVTLNIGYDYAQLLAIDNSVTIGHIIDSNAWPNRRIAIIGSIVYNISHLNHDSVWDASIPLVIYLETNGDITINELPAQYPANQVDIKFRDGSTYSYPRPSTSFFQVDTDGSNIVKDNYTIDLGTNSYPINFSE